MSFQISLEGKCAVVTGGGGGIGASICELLAVAGANVVVGDIDGGAAENVAKKIKAKGNEAIAYATDVTSPSSVEQLFELCQQHYEGVDIFVACAGVSDKTDIFDLELDEWNQIININLTGTFLCSKKASESMRANGTKGRIIYIGSPTAYRGGYNGHVAYSSSKGGLLGMSKTLARTLAKDRITVNVITPGQTDTDLLWRVNSKESLEKIINAVPLGLASPSDIAAGVLFLASEYSGHITGTTIDIDGGGTMR